MLFADHLEKISNSGKPGQRLFNAILTKGQARLTEPLADKSHETEESAEDKMANPPHQIPQGPLDNNTFLGPAGSTGPLSFQYQEGQVSLVLLILLVHCIQNGDSVVSWRRRTGLTENGLEWPKEV